MWQHKTDDLSNVFGKRFGVLTAMRNVQVNYKNLAALHCIFFNLCINSMRQMMHALFNFYQYNI